MKKIILVLTIGLMIAPAANAVPDLQLFIDGATYDWGTQTWVLATTGSVNLYVISANEIHTDVYVSIALTGFGKLENPDGIVGVSGFGGPLINDWTWGYAPLATAEFWDANEDLPRHGVYPTWFTEVNTGDYGLGDFVGDVQPDENTQTGFWDPSDPLVGEYPAPGEYRLFDLNINAPIGTGLYFDAYTLDGDAIDIFAPFSHNASTTIVPEPGTILLMSTGLLGLGLSAIRRRKR